MGEPNKKLWIGNLSYKVAKDDLDVLFRQHGTIVDIKLLDKGPHVYAFVEYEKQDSAVEAYEKLQSRELKGNAMKIEFANGRKRTNNRDRDPRGDRDSHRKRDNYRRRSRSHSNDRHKQKSKSHRRRSSSSESSRHRKISKQNRNKPKSPDDSGLSQS